ncbi:MAG: hypothetical protein U0572_11230 [Phycisphaerales bacterium]
MNPFHDILGEGTNQRLNIQVQPVLVSDWDAYAGGYRAAAEALYEHLQHAISISDASIFPFVFLWRHHLELRLKALCFQARDLYGDSSKSINGHQLPQLLDLLSRDLERLHEHIGESFDCSQLSELKARVKAVHMRDPGSEIFRYPVNRGGGSQLPPVRIMNFQAVHRTMSELANMLDGVAIAIDMIADWKRDMSGSYPEAHQSDSA